jgi:hypothetical protein
MTGLILKRASASRPSGEWDDDDHDVLADGVVVGRIMKAAVVLAAVALSVVVATPAVAEDSVLQSLPTDVQKGIEEIRASCRSIDELKDRVTSGDEGLVTFTVSSRQAVLVDDKLLCGICIHGTNCSKTGTRNVRVYILFGNAWKKFLSDLNITEDIFVSYVPNSQKLNALVVDLQGGNKGCPTRWAPTASGQWYERRSCVVRWNGTKFTYKPL